MVLDVLVARLATKNEATVKRSAHAVTTAVDVSQASVPEKLHTVVSIPQTMFGSNKE